MRLELVELHGDEEIRQRIPLDSFPIQLGRGTSEQVGFIPLPNCGGAYLSKLHCTIFNRGKALFLADGDPQGKPSHNGIWLDGKPIKKPVLLYPGQIFVLLNPPPCEIQIRVLEGAETEEDTLTPAARNFLEHPDSAEALESLSLAVAQLRGHWQENQALDLKMRGEVAQLQAERGALREDLRIAKAEGRTMLDVMDQRLHKQEKGQRKLVRFVSGVALAVALLSGALLVGDEERQGRIVDASIHIILGIVGTGGLAMSAKAMEAGSRDDGYRNSRDARAEEIAP